MKIGNITPREITQELKQSYLDYAMSVIVARALPDVRDGLKPVHRRILYAMRELGLRHTSKFRKSATVVGEVLGKYHPHGDAAVYDTLVRLAQDFALRYPLVEGQGNFGSMDGDSPAAMRYTEARLGALAEVMMEDIEKETVDFVDNYDGTRKEPTVLPAKVPQLLLNGTFGIAVGMATKIPPHNLNEVVDGVVHLIDHPDADIEALMQFIKGPDFPTGGFIYGQKDIAGAYLDGKGSIVMRAQADIIEKKPGQFQIVISELTYETNKASLIEKIAELVKVGKVDGIKDIRDESDREEKVRIVIELKKDAYPNKVLNKLYTTTELQKSFHVNMLALVDGIVPQVLNLKSILEHFIEHRRQVVLRRTKFDLARAKERAHILEGLKKALDHIDAIIATIKKSANREAAHGNLMKKFKLTDRQTTAILEMKLQTLSGLERKKIEDELKEKRALIQELESVLKTSKKVLGIIKKELLGLKEKFGDERRTRLVKGRVSEFSQEDLIPNEEAIITLSAGGYIKRMNPTVYRVQHRGGKGVIGASIKEGDVIEKLLAIMTHDNILFFTNTGKVYQLKAYEIPESSRTAKGQALVNFLQVAPDEKVTAMVSFGEGDFKYVFMTTRHGIVKKAKINEFAHVRRSGLIAIKLQKGDELCWVDGTAGSDEIIITTAGGQAIHFRESDVRSMGRNAAGVRGIKLRGDDKVVGMDVMLKNQKGNQLMAVTEKGYGKRTNMKQYKLQRRGGSGIKTAKVTTKTGKLIGANLINIDELEADLIITSEKGQIIRIPLESVSELGRATQGVRLMKPQAGDKLAAVTVV